MNTSDEFWVAIPGQNEAVGPVEYGDLLAQAHAGTIAADASVCRVGDSEWLPLADLVPAAPPLRTSTSAGGSSAQTSGAIGMIDCTYCGGRVPVPPGSKPIVCAFCKTVLPRPDAPPLSVREKTSAEREERGPLFPNFSNRPIPCPDCEKKALRPRVRTRDFRCQACNATFPGDEIEALIDRMARRELAESTIAGVLRNVLVRAMPEQYRSGDSFWNDWLQATKAKDAEPSGIAMLVALLAAIAAGIGIFVGLESWSIWLRGGLTFGVLFVLFAGATSLSTSASAAAIERRCRKERAAWEGQNLVLVAVLAHFDGLLYKERMEQIHTKEKGLFEASRKDEDGEPVSVAVARVQQAHGKMLLAQERHLLGLTVELALTRVRCLVDSPERRTLVEPAVAQHGTDQEKTRFAYSIKDLQALSAEEGSAGANA